MKAKSFAAPAKKRASSRTTPASKPTNCRIKASQDAYKVLSAVEGELSQSLNTIRPPPRRTGRGERVSAEGRDCPCRKTTPPEDDLSAGGDWFWSA